MNHNSFDQSLNSAGATIDLLNFLGRPPPPSQNSYSPPPPYDEGNDDSQSHSEEESINGSKSDDDVDFEELQKDQDKGDEDNEFVPPVTKKRRGRPKSVNSNSNFGQGENDKTCKVCGKTFTVAASLRRHLVTHTEKKQQFECDICHTKFTQKPSLMTHMKRQHLGELNFPCPHCEKKYVRNVELKEHIASAHRSLLPTQKSKCTICSKVYDSQALLNMHMSYHTRLEKGKATNLTDLRCPTCEKVYNTAAILKKHMKSHSTERPFECPHCPKRFRLRYFMGQHIRNVHLAVMKYVSKFCGREFTFASKRDIHDKHHEINGICQQYRPRKLFACDLCRESVKSEYLLNLHKKEKHPEMKLKLRRILVMDIFKKRENGLRLVRLDKGGDGENQVEKWQLCMKCGRAHKDENMAKSHNETCEIPLPNLSMEVIKEEQHDEEHELHERRHEIENLNSEKLAMPKSVKQRLKSHHVRKAKKLLNKKSSKPKNKLDVVSMKENEIKEESNELDSVESRKISKLNEHLVEVTGIKEEINESNELDSMDSKNASKSKSNRKSTNPNSQRKKKTKTTIKQKKEVIYSKSKLKKSPDFVPIFSGPELPESNFLEEIELKDEPLSDFELISEVETGEEDEWLNFNISDRVEDIDDSTTSGDQDPLQIENSPAKMSKRKQDFRNTLSTYRMVLPPVNVIPLPSSSISSSSSPAPAAPVKTYERKQNFRNSHPRIPMLRPPKNVNSSIKTISSPPPPPSISNPVLLHIIPGTEVVQLQNQCLNSQKIGRPSVNVSTLNLSEPLPNINMSSSIASSSPTLINPAKSSSCSLTPFHIRVISEEKSLSIQAQNVNSQMINIPVRDRIDLPAQDPLQIVFNISEIEPNEYHELDNVAGVKKATIARKLDPLSPSFPSSSLPPGSLPPIVQRILQGKSTSRFRKILPKKSPITLRSTPPARQYSSRRSTSGSKPQISSVRIDDPGMNSQEMETNSSINSKTNPTKIDRQSSFPPNYPSSSATVSRKNVDISDEVQPISPPVSPGPLPPISTTENSGIPEDSQEQVISPQLSSQISPGPGRTSESDSNSNSSPPPSRLPTSSKPRLPPRQKYSDEEFAEKLKKYSKKDYSLYTKFIAGEDLPYECTKCLKKLATRDKLRVHVRCSHLGLRNHYGKGKISAIQEFNQKHFNVALVDRENVYQCKLCLKEFTRRLQAVNHVMRHEATSEWQKEYMNVLIGDESTLTYQCKACLMTFKKKEKLRLHVDKIHKKVSFLCDICGISLTRKQSLEDHRRVHMGEKPFKCKVCGFRTVSKVSLTIHKRSHLSKEERETLRLLCDECDYSTFSKQQFKYHQNQHLPEEEREDLPSPRKQKQESCKCSTCGKVFTTPSACQVHEHFQHASEKIMPFTCRICDQKFTIKCNAKQHVKGKHKKELKTGTKVDELLIIDKSLLPPMKGPPKARYSS